MSEQLYKLKKIEKDGNVVESYEPYTPIAQPAQPKPQTISVEELGAWLEGALSVGSTGESIAVDMLARYEVFAK